MCTNTQTCTHMYTYMHVCTHTCMHTHMHTFTHTKTLKEYHRGWKRPRQNSIFQTLRVRAAMVPIQDRVTQQLTMKEEGLRSPHPQLKSYWQITASRRRKSVFLGVSCPSGWSTPTNMQEARGKHELGKLVVNRLQRSYTKMWEGRIKIHHHGAGKRPACKLQHHHHGHPLDSVLPIPTLSPNPTHFLILSTASPFLQLDQTPQEQLQPTTV